jgi:hypothetical protein
MRKLLLLLSFAVFAKVSFSQLTQNFESGTFPPAGWLLNPSVGDTWETETTGANGGDDALGDPFSVNPHGGTGMAIFRSYDFSSGVTAELISSAFSLTTGAPHVAKFWFHQDDGYPTRPDSIAVYINTSASFTGATRLGNVSRPIATPAQQWKQFSFNIPAAFNGATNYIIFKAYSRFGNNLFIDDISVESAPSCINPAVTVSGITTTAATLSWGAAGGATGYEWAVTTSPTPPASGTATALTTVNATSLTPGTPYYAHVRTQCGAPFSAWTSEPFNTVITNDDCSGAVTLTIGSGTCGGATGATTAGATESATTPLPTCGVGSSGYDDDVWFKITPAAGQTSLNIDFASISGDADMVAQVYTSSDNTCAGTFTAVDCSDDDGPGSMPQFTGLTVVPGATYFVRVFTYSTTVSGAFSICAYTPPPPPPCTTNIAPANGATGVLIPGGIANFSWNASAGATSYNVFFGTVNPPTTNIGSTGGTSVNITGLSYNTTYYWYIQPVGAGGAAVGCSTSTTGFTTENPANCTPVYSIGCGSGDSLTYFSLKGASGTAIYNATGNACSASPLAYSNFTALPAVSLTRGETFSGKMRTGDANDWASMWIDANDNGFFEDNERIMNNLKIGTTTKLYAVYIPATMNLGTHRLRVRTIYSFGKPAALTHPCNPFTYGETEDYSVTITNVGTTRNVAPGTPGSCMDAAEITIDAASNNNLAAPVSLLDSMNNVIAGIYPDGNNLGTVKGNYYVHNGPVRQDVTGRYYMDRNMSIGVDSQPAAPYRLRYFYRNAELNALIAQPGSGVTSQFDLNMTKTNGPECVTLYVQQSPTLQFPIGFGSLSGDRFLDFTGFTSFSRFFLHGGSSVLLPVTLTNLRGEVTGSSNTVYWTTAQEQNNAKFIIERSVNGSDFTAIGEVNSKALNGNSSAPLNYNFADANPVSGKAFYRLRMVDLSAKQSLSPVVTILRGKGSLEIVDVRPNPTTGMLYFNIIGSSNTIRIVIRNIDGKEVVSKGLVQSNGFSIDMSALASGLYLLEATNMKDGERAVYKVVKQ